MVKKINSSLFQPSPQPSPLQGEGEATEKKINIKIILACLKILNIFGLLYLEHKNLETKKILNFINNNSFSRISLLI